MTHRTQGFFANFQKRNTFPERDINVCRDETTNYKLLKQFLLHRDGPLTNDAHNKFVTFCVQTNQERVVHDDVTRQEVCVIVDGTVQYKLGVRPNVQGRVNTRCNKYKWYFSCSILTATVLVLLNTHCNKEICIFLVQYSPQQVQMVFFRVQ